jgi:hypothetical protein
VRNENEKRKILFSIFGNLLIEKTSEFELMEYYAFDEIDKESYEVEMIEVVLT